MTKSIVSILSLTLVIFVLFFVSFSSNENIDLSEYSTEGLVLNYTVSLDGSITDNTLTSNEGNRISPPFTGQCFVGFKEALAFKESGGNYFTVNSYGYLGKYQFGKEAFIANAQRNKWILRRDIKTFVGKRINGILVTESGILAAAHLAGPGSVKKYLRSYGLDNFTDGYGTTLCYYMKKFSGYDTSFLKPNKKAKVGIV